MNVQSFAAEWIAAWNARDLERILSHYDLEIELVSPLAKRLVPGSGGTIRGLEALRSYWSRGLALNPDLHFELVDALESVSGCTLVYNNHRRQLVAETLFFDEEGKVIRASAAYSTPRAEETANAGCVVVLVARIPEGGVELFNRYEDAVLPLLQAHGGLLQRRLRSADARAEVHLVWFPSASALDAFRADPARAAAQPWLVESGTESEVLQLEDVLPLVS